MTTFKKKDLKKYTPKEEIDEITIGDVELSGDGLEDNEGGQANINNNEISVKPHIKLAGKSKRNVTTNDVEMLGLQHRQPYGNGNSMAISAASTIAHESIKTNKGKLDEIAKTKMRELVEDMLTNKNSNSGLVSKPSDSIITGKSNQEINTNTEKEIISPDVDENGIPDIKELNNTTITTNTIQFISFIKDTELQGEDKGIVLNYILSNINLSDIPSNYKEILTKQING